MREAILKYGFFYGALLVVGAIAWRLTSLATDAGGGHGASLLNSANVGLSVAVGLAAVLLAVGTGLVAGKFVSPSGGLLDMGVVLAWGAYGFGTLRQIVAAKVNADTGEGTGSVLIKLAIEAAIVGALVTAAAWLIERTGRKVEVGDEPKQWAWSTTLLCGVVGSIAGVWLIAQSGYKGQIIGAAMVGGVIAGIAAYAMDHNAKLWPLVAGCAIVSIGGPVFAMATGGNDRALHAAVVAATVPRWASLTGLDGMAGACLGIPVGLYVAKGLLGHAGQIADEAR